MKEAVNQLETDLNVQLRLTIEENQKNRALHQLQQVTKNDNLSLLSEQLTELRLLATDNDALQNGLNSFGKLLDAATMLNYQTQSEKNY